MEHQKIFATNLFLIDDFIPEKDTQGMKDYISNLWKNRDYDNNWQTKSANLHKQSMFYNFSKAVLDTSKQIIKKLDYDADDIIITDMWANVLKSNEHHPTHTHSNNFLSGTYYLHSDQGASIVFHDPRPAADVIVPRKKRNYSKQCKSTKLCF